MVATSPDLVTVSRSSLRYAAIEVAAVAHLTDKGQAARTSSSTGGADGASAGERYRRRVVWRADGVEWMHSLCRATA